MKHEAVVYASNAASISRAMRDCEPGRAIGIIIIAISDGSPGVTDSIECVFRAHHAAGWQGSLWIVVVADRCDGATLAAARRTVGAFGQVLPVDTRSTRASCAIGEALVAQHLPGSPRCPW